MGDTVILTERDSMNSKIAVPKEWQPMTVWNDSVARG
jgi:hypothetical protein